MTNRQAKICEKVVMYKRLDIILKKAKISDYIVLQEELGPGGLLFEDIDDDETEVTLSNELQEELETRHRRIVDVWVTRFLSVVAIIISVIALFRS